MTATAAPPTGQPQNMLRLLQHVTRNDSIGWAVLHDAFLEASARQWRRRAEQLEAARPRRGDFTGHARPHDLAAQYRRLTEAAAACRHRAELADLTTAEYSATVEDLAGGAA